MIKENLQDMKKAARENLDELEHIIASAHSSWFGDILHSTLHNIITTQIRMIEVLDVLERDRHTHQQFYGN